MSKPVDGPLSAHRPALIAAVGALAVPEQAGRELEQDLRLGVAAHRAEHGHQIGRRAKRSAGDNVCGGRRPGPNSAGWPASRLKPIPRLWRLIPVFGSASHDPSPAAFDWISETPMPSPSTVHR